MKATEELVLAGVKAGEFQCAFDGLGATVAKKRLTESGWGNLSNLLRQISHRLHVIQVRAAMDQFVHLRFGRAMTCGLLWPALTTEIPEKQSRYSRPLASQTLAPLARSITMGATDFTKPVIT